MAAASNVTRLAPGRSAAPLRTRRLPPGLLSGLAASLLALWRTARTRRTLAGMDDRMLADIGISRAQAAFEASRLPWDTELR